MDEQEIKEGLSVKRILAQFKNDEGQLVGTPLDLPIDITPESLAILCNVVLQDVIIIKPFTLHMLVDKHYKSTPTCTRQLVFQKVTLISFLHPSV